jgi:hypothetical protein
MKKHIALLTLAAAALVVAPATLRAQDAPAPKQDAGDSTTKHNKGTPFHGKVASVDTTASTVTVGHMTINVTSDTKITKEGKPATLADITTGENISGSYKKDGDKMNATVIHIGGKGGKGHKSSNQ